jgi:hypothetical protein
MSCGVGRPAHSEWSTFCNSKLANPPSELAERTAFTLGLSSVQSGPTAPHPEPQACGTNNHGQQLRCFSFRQRRNAAVEPEEPIGPMEVLPCAVTCSSGRMLQLDGV